MIYLSIKKERKNHTVFIKTLSIFTENLEYSILMKSYLIIDNNLNSIANIKKVLEDYIDFNCIGVSDNYNNAMNIILKEAPDLVFFNIDNVFEKTFEFVQELLLFNNDFPAIIAISTSKEMAYEVIKNDFFDFLLKPLSELEIRKSILKVLKRTPTQSRKSICLKSYKDYQYLKTDEILYLKADNNATDFFMNDGNVISAYKTLKTFENILPNNFHRIHKSYIINKNFVSRIQFGKFTCTIKRNKLEIPFTKTYIENIKIMKKTLSEYSYQSIN
tara:strand:- start:190 stop:1011 length:822 start_codon:yes stop_codon:yes gene_type:complete